LYFDDEGNTINWEDYDVVDKNDNRYPIKRVLAPYDATTIFDIINVTSGLNSILIQTNAAHGLANGNYVDLQEIVGTLINPNDEITINNSIFKINNVTTDTFEIFQQVTDEALVLNFTYVSGGVVRKMPLSSNVGPFKYKITVKGLFTSDQYITYQNEVDVNYTGFLISPKKKVINVFSLI